MAFSGEGGTPAFCRQFFIGIEATTASRTRLAYAYDIGCFFEYLQTVNPICQKMPLREIPISILNEITPMDIEEYLEHCTYYTKDGKEYMNDERGKARKLASLRSFYNYFFRNEMIEKNPAALVQMPKLHDKEIIRLDPDEVAILLDTVESGEKLTKKQLQYHEKNKLRDIALLTLMLGTGLRVSECVGIDIQDVDFKNNGVKIRRKGGYEAIVYFGEEVELALLDYLEQRSNTTPVQGHEDALKAMQEEGIGICACQ